MRLYEFFNVINIRVKYRITDRVTKESIKTSIYDKNTLNRKIYMIFQDDDGTLNISLF